jgi:hypothetical protein
MVSANIRSTSNGSKHWPEIEGREISESRILGKRTSDARFASEENWAFVF